MDYDIVVIGAGNGGLTASATLARKGPTFAGGSVGNQGFEPTLRSGTLAAKTIMRQMNG